MFRQMEKLIDLLNKHRREKVNKQSGITQWHYNGYTFSLDNLKAQQAELLIISKQYGFIKWLVENEKIAYDIPNNSDLYKCFELACVPLDNTDYITMLLSIQDEPIEFLVSILK